MAEITGIGAATSASAPAPTVDRRDQYGKDTFLKLLVAQLKYQNPLEPSDGSQFMAQTAQFTMVEKLEELARQNTELLASHRLSAAGGLMGREVTYAGADGADTTGVVGGVKVTAGGPVLLVDGREVALAAVRAVKA